MATKAIQLHSSFIHWDDNVYSLTDKYGDSEGYFVIKKISDQSVVCRIYPDGIVKWDQPPTIGTIVAVGQHLRIPLP